MYEFGQEEIDAAVKVLKTGQFFRYRGGEDGEVTRMEKRLVETLGCDYSVVMTSGTASLICGLIGMGIGPGDEVIVPAYTWLASAGAILGAGAIPVLADVDETLTLDPEDLERKIGPRTKAVLPVHMAGRPSDMDRIQAIAKKHNLKILEDACQAIGGTYKGRFLGTIGDAGAFSFNQFKNLSCGEGGCLLTSDRKVYERALYHHDMGCTFRGHVGEMTEPAFLGNTYRMNEILGAILNAQFDRMDSILSRLRERAQWLIDAVNGEESPLMLTPSADRDGDCGCNVSFLFESAEARRQVAERFHELSDKRFSMMSPIDSGLHVYTNWTVLLEQKGGHSPETNPFTMAANADCRLDISADDCPRTLELLDRSALIGIGLGHEKGMLQEIGRLLCQAARDVLACK